MTNTQRVIKYLAIAFAISLIVGIFSSIYFGGKAVVNSFVNNDHDIINIDNYNNDSKVLYIDLKTTELEIIKGEELKVINENKYVKIKKNDNKMSIEEESHLFKRAKGHKLTLFIPDNFELDEVYIYTGAGSISIEKLVSKRLTLKLGASKVSIDKLVVTEDTDIESGTGKVIIKNANITKSDLKMGVGEFNFEGVFNGKSTINAGIGEININLLDGISNYKIYAEKGIGSIYIDGKSVDDETTYGSGDKSLEVDGGIGEINIK